MKTLIEQFRESLLIQFLYYDIFETDGSDQKWFIGTVRVVGVEDNLNTRNDAVKQSRQVTKHGFKFNTIRSSKQQYELHKLVS